MLPRSEGRRQSSCLNWSFQLWFGFLSVRTAYRKNIYKGIIILYASRLTYMYNILQRFEMMAILTNDYPSKQQ